MLPTARACLLGLCAAAFASTVSFAADDIDIRDAWARANAETLNGGAFLTLRNNGAAADRLIAARSPGAKRIELRTVSSEGVLQKTGVIEIPAGGQVTLQPGGPLLALYGVDPAAREAKTLPLTLVFERAGQKTLDVPIGRPAAANSGVSKTEGVEARGSERMGGGGRHSAGGGGNRGMR